MTVPPQPPIRNSSLDRYLLRGERIVVATHDHWAVMLRPLGILVLATIFVLWLDATLPPTADGFIRVLWIAWFAVFLWAGWQVFEWRHDWFMATNKRLLLFHGVPRKVAMMPLIKVTDMTYERTIPGWFLRYGRFILESAGQDQALSEINYVVNPDTNYQKICSEIFGVPQRELGGFPPPPRRVDIEGGPPVGGGPPVEGDDWMEDPYSPSRRHHEWLPDDAPHAIPTRGYPRDEESLYRSPDLIRKQRQADTGPIPVYPPPPESED